MILKARNKPGVYVLTITTKDKNYVNKGGKIFRKVFHHINSTEIPMYFPTSQTEMNSRLSSIRFQDQVLTIWTSYSTKECMQTFRKEGLPGDGVVLNIFFRRAEA